MLSLLNLYRVILNQFWSHLNLQCTVRNCVAVVSLRNGKKSAISLISLDPCGWARQSSAVQNNKQATIAASYNFCVSVSYICVYFKYVSLLCLSWLSCNLMHRDCKWACTKRAVILTFCYVGATANTRWYLLFLFLDFFPQNVIYMLLVTCYFCSFVASWLQVKEVNSPKQASIRRVACCSAKSRLKILRVSFKFMACAPVQCICVWDTLEWSRSWAYFPHQICEVGK